MDNVIEWLANYLLFVMVVVTLATWALREDRRTKVFTAVVSVLGLVIAGVLMFLASHLHTDARPFVQNPSLHPLIKHSADNGFPSDHSVAAALLTGVMIARHRIVGAVLAVAAVLVAVARVAAHVHHVQDVVAGLAIGLLAAWLATLLVTRVLGWHPSGADRRQSASTVPNAG